MRGIFGALLACTLSMTTTGCLKKVLIDGNISGTKDGSEAVSTLHDFEVARSVARAGLGTLEGLYKLAPDNEDAMFLLTRSWAGATFAFTEDEYELAQEQGDSQLAQYHLMRARAGFDRAKFFGAMMLETKAHGFEHARRNADALKEWLTDNFKSKDEALDLAWASFAWIGHVGVSRDVPSVIAELWVGAAIAERSVELDETANHGMAHILLGAYHARTAQSEMDEAKKQFDAAIRVSEGKYLPAKLNYAIRYLCAKSDRKGYEKALNEILAAGDPIPEARLDNLVAKRRARRYLDNKIFQEDCGFID